MKAALRFAHRGNQALLTNNLLLNAFKTSTLLLNALRNKPNLLLNAQRSKLHDDVFALCAATIATYEYKQKTKNHIGAEAVLGLQDGLMPSNSRRMPFCIPIQWRNWAIIWGQPTGWREVCELALEVAEQRPAPGRVMYRLGTAIAITVASGATLRRTARNRSTRVKVVELQAKAKPAAKDE